MPPQVECLGGAHILEERALGREVEAWEGEYFGKVKSVSASDITIRDILSRSDGLATLKQEYRNIFAIAIFFVVLSTVVWGYFFVNLGL